MNGLHQCFVVAPRLPHQQPVNTIQFFFCCILTIARSAPFSSDVADMFYVIFAAHCPIKASQDTFQMGPLGFQAVHSICWLCKLTFAAEDAFISA